MTLNVGASSVCRIKTLAFTSSVCAERPTPKASRMQIYDATFCQQSAGANALDLDCGESARHIGDCRMMTS